MQESHHFDHTEEISDLDLDALPILYATKMQGGVLFIPEEEVLQQLADEQEHITVQSADPQELLAARSTQPLPMQKPPLQAAPTPKVSLRVIAIVLLVNIGLLLAVLLPILLQTVTIVIIPKTQTLTTHLTLSSMQSRVFSPLTLTQTKTVPATGHGYQPALQAHGSLTFYNASPQEQTIDAGTLFISADGVQVVSDQAADLPGSQPPIETQVTVSAHAVTPGAAGSIKPGAITGACCKAGVYVTSSQFRGGQDARAYQIVTQADIHGVVSSLLPTVTLALTTSFAKQVRPTETLTAVHCTHTITADPPVQQEAARVTVSIQQSCIAAAYTTSSLQTTIVQLLSQREPGYKLKSYFQLEPLDTSLHGNRLSISSTYQATYRYQFTQAETDKVLSEIKGKQRRQVARLLEQLPGVEHITITAPLDQDTLPTDASYIHLLIIEG